MKRTASLGLEQTLSEHDFRRLAEIPEGEVDDSLDVVGIGVLPSERVGETGWSIDHAELPSQIEGVPLWRIGPFSPLIRSCSRFTDPNELARWWGSEGFSTPSLEFDPSVGENYRIEMQPISSVRPSDRVKTRGSYAGPKAVDDRRLKRADVAWYSSGTITGDLWRALAVGRAAALCALASQASAAS